MKRIFVVFSAGLLLTALTPVRSWAQAVAQISGSVQDQSGAVLPGAEITATQTDTGISRMAVTNENGYYVLPSLPLGPYKLEASLPGFRSFAQTGIVLQVGSNPTINVVLQVDQCLCDNSNQRPDLRLPNAIYLDKSGRPGTQYLNPAAFGMPALGTLGNLGRVTLKLPTAWQFDMALSRLFRFREKQSLEFRAEAYNVLNSFRPGIIDTNLSAANFGKIRTALDPRVLQFALKYLF